MHALKWNLLKSTALLGACGLIGLSAPASAQAADENVGSKDIIVTAQRFAQRLQDVPLSVTAMGGDELRSRDVATLSDLQYAVSGLSLFEYGPGKEFIQMRGMATISGAATVGIYLDETPLASDVQGSSTSVRLLDMERVEVLRGPQATLYGDSSMGGTIRYIPAAPKFDAVSGSAEVEASSTKGGSAGYKAVGMINLPLSEKAAIRIVGGYERVGGYIDNVTLNRNDVNKTDYHTLRGTLLAKPSERLTVSVMGLYQKGNQANQDFGIDYVTVVPTNSYNRDHYTLVQGKADYDLDVANLTFTASYIDHVNSSLSDITPFYAPLVSAPPPFGVGLPDGFVTQVGLVGRSHYKTYYTETRLASQGDSKLGWQVGANYRKLKYTTVANAQTAPNALPLSLLDYVYDDDHDYLSVYGEVYYSFTPKLKATAGVRYFRQKKREDVDSTSFGVSTLDIGRAVFKTVNPRFNLSYQFTPDSMIYANVAKGFRGGGFNPASAGGGVYFVPPTYDPDEIWNYEIGTKHQLFDRKLTFDASVYRSYWKKVQSYGFIPGSPITVINNAGDVKGWGVDVAVTARPTSTLTLSSSYGWNNLAFSGTTADKNKGDPVDGAVRKSFSASADFRPPLSDSVTGIARVDYQHTGKAQITLRNYGGQVIPRPGRDLVNLRIGAAFGRIELTAFATNLFDVNKPLIIGPYGVFVEDLAQRPRVIGLNASTKF